MRRAASAAATVLTTLALTGCSAAPRDVMATATCPDPLHRVLVATQTSAPGSDDRVGEATPSPSIDPGEQHRIAASAVFDPEGRPERALPVTVTLEDGTGSGAITEAETCQVLTVVVALSADELSTPHGTVQPGRLELRNSQGAGSLRLVDQPTYIRDADDGSGVQDYGSITGWYALLEAPAAGEYRTQRAVTWQPATPAADSTGVPRPVVGLPLQGLLDLVVIIG